MRKNLQAAYVLGLVGMLYAAQAAFAQEGEMIAPPAAAPAPAFPAPAVAAPGTVIVNAPDGPCCEPAPCKVCVTVPTTVKKTRWVYDCKEVDYCLPKCPKCGLGCHQEKDCGCEDGCCKGCGHKRPCSLCDGVTGPCACCGKPRTKRVLIKHLVTEECESSKCEVQCQVPEVCPAPCCPTGGPGHACLPAQGAVSIAAAVPAAAPVTTPAAATVPMPAVASQPLPMGPTTSDPAVSPVNEGKGF